MIELSTLRQFDFASHPMTDAWEGPDAHIGPVQTITPLVRLLGGKTTFGTVTLMSGVIVWAAARLRPFTDVSYLDELAVAAFAWQHDRLYLQHKATPKGKAPEEPVEVSAAMVLREMFLRSIFRPIAWKGYHQPLIQASHLVNVTAFILPDPARDAFEVWLKDISVRLSDIAPVPDLPEPDSKDFDSPEDYYAYCTPMRGAPLPPAVLDLETDVSSLDLQAEAVAFLNSLEPSQNRYLRSAEEMAEEGFEGVPYGRGA